MKYSGIVDTIRNSDKALRVHAKLKVGRQDKTAADILELLDKKYREKTLGLASDALEILRILYLYKNTPMPGGAEYEMAKALILDLEELYGSGKDNIELADACDTARWWLIFIASIIPDQPVPTG